MRKRDPKFVTNFKEQKRRASKGLSLEDVTHLGGEGVWQIVTVANKKLIFISSLR